MGGEELIRKLAKFVANMSPNATNTFRQFSAVARMVHRLMEQMRENNQWWKQGISPDADGVYPDQVFSQRWDKDDPPSFDMSA